MAGNSFGKDFHITTFGESHGKGMGVVIDGCPAGIPINEEKIREELDRRKPGQSKLTTQRKEDEAFAVQSGIFQGQTLGSPIAITIPNKDAKPSEYQRFKDVYRPSHADYTYEAKYGIRDYRGGGRSSARETVNWVTAGAIAKQVLSYLYPSLQLNAFVQQIGHVELNSSWSKLDFGQVEQNPVRCPDPEKAEAMQRAIEEARKNKDSLGGCIGCQIYGVPTGLGEPVFNKLEADLAKAMLSINATKGFEIGEGFHAASMKGSEHNDPFTSTEDGAIETETNHSGGLQGGISNGSPIDFRVAFKPVATIAQPQDTVDQAGKPTTLEGKGRHDPCVVPRAVPIVEAMAALVLTDHALRSRGNLT